MSKEKKFFEELQKVFMGTKVEGKGGFIHLMQIKAYYYKNKIEGNLKTDIENALQNNLEFKDELYTKLFDFFSRYFSENGSIFFNSTPFHNNIYEKVYTDDRDVILFWKTQMLYYVKTDILFKSLTVPIEDFKFIIDASKIEHKKNNERRDVIYEYISHNERKDITLQADYSTNGRKKKVDEILKKTRDTGLTEEILVKATKNFEKQSEVDYFIHKDAKTFLQEQFKLWSYQYFWEGAKEWTSERVNQLQILKDIALKVIDFISQFEDELVKIWNKPKFVRKSNYVVTLDRIADRDVDVLRKVVAHKGMSEQIKEWQELGIVKESFAKKDILATKKTLSDKFRTLPIDTKYFKDIELDIIGVFENLDDDLDGWLIKSENYQALNTIKNKFHEQVQTIYIDPPYNTNSSPIIYVNKYKHSSWLSILKSRVDLSKHMLSSDGINVVAIDDVEHRYLVTLLDSIYGINNYVTTIATECNPQGRVANKVSQTCEYHTIHANDINKIDNLLVPKLYEKKPTSLKRTGTNSRREERPYRYYPILIKGNKIYMITREEYKKIYIKEEKTFDDNHVNSLKVKYESKGYKFILPLSKDGECFVWQRTYDRVNIEKDTYIIKDLNILTPSNDKEIPRTLWKHPLFSNPEYGSEYLKHVMGYKEFSTPKSYYTVMNYLSMTEKGGICLDYFGGSGTTAQAVIELNKLEDDDKQRKYIVIEQDNYFDSVLVPRIKKICWSNKWKMGVSGSCNYASQFFKYYELEQYEEVLDRCKYEDGDLFDTPGSSPYNDYVFLKDEKMLKAVKIDYKNNKVQVNLSKLYDDIDIAETLSNLLGKHIKKITKMR